MASASPPFSRWLLRRPTDNAAGRVFCFPYSGVGASMFSRWPRSIGSIDVCPIQLPGRENRLREPHFGTHERLGELVAAALASYIDRPCVLFGHCSGALSAFETARVLAQATPSAPVHLIVSAQAPPHRCPHDRFLDLTDEELAAELALITVAQGGTAHPLLTQLTLGVLREDLQANRVYRKARTRLPFAVTVIGWSADREIDAETLREWTGYADHVRFRELPGGHYEFLSAPRALLDVAAAQLLLRTSHADD